MPRWHSAEPPMRRREDPHMVAPVKKVIFYEESTGWGGTEKYLFDLATRVAAEGHEAYLLTRSLRPAEEEEFGNRFQGFGGQVVWLRGAPESSPKELARLRSEFSQRAGVGTVIHFNQQTPASMATAILAA